MKRLIIVLLSFALSANMIFAQLSGNGTSSSPYTGTLNQNTVWYPDSYAGGTLYAMNITIPSGLTLTISPGEYNGGHVQFTGTTVLTINAGGTFIIDPQTSVTVHNITNNGTMRLESFANEPGIASLIHRVYSGTGVVETELYLSGGTTPVNDYKWHYISVPVNNVSVSTFSTLNLAQYIESLVIGADNYPGWVAYDGYQYSSGTNPGPTFSTLDLGVGYNYYSAAGATYTLTGTLNIGDLDVLVYCGTDFPDYQGYNLLGNPFASCLNWDVIIEDYTPAYVQDAIYFTNNGLIASYVNGTGSDGGTSTIPPLQGFFVKATAVSDVYLASAARTHNLDQQRYKKKSTGESYSSSDTISFVRLQLKNAPDSADLVVRFNNKATAEADKMFDAYEFSKTAGSVNIWSISGNVAYSINGLPFPETTVSVPVGINIKTAGTFKLSSNELKNLDYYSVILKDLKTNKTADLKKGEFIEFNATEGMTEDRFIIVITKSATAVPEYSSTEKKFRVYFSSGLINIMPLSDEYANVVGSVTIYNLAGSKMFQQNNIDWQGYGVLKQFTPKPEWRGTYIVEVKAGNWKFVEKINLL
ncbi:MAG: hypothetical protein IH594_05485 [Bacteroidales bacterium]|nr:hypothetical protein [Bacteroidales bacterium]